jgi:6-phosphogluconolactonase
MMPTMNHDSSRAPTAAAPRDLTRRDFLAAAGVGLIACARSSSAFAQPGASPSDESLLYVGTYTENTKSEGIYVLRMNSRTGQLRRVGSMNAGVNPSFLAVHPNGRVLYAVNEVEKHDGKAGGAVRSFTIASDGGLANLNGQGSGGAGPCYVSVDKAGRVALVANYDGGSVAVVPIQSDGSLAPSSQVVPHVGRGPVVDRQSAPHAHCILSDPSNRFALSADLGADRIFLYRLDPENGAIHHVDRGDAVMRPGAGPRHIAFHPTLPLVFVANELDSTVATLLFDRERGALSLKGQVSTIPSGTAGTNYPADIHIAPSGRTLYVSNRGHNSIAVFSVADSTGALSRDQVLSTGGDWPRNFCLDPTGRWLLVANERSSSIVVLSRDQRGRLAATSQRIEVPSPVCLSFRSQ